MSARQRAVFSGACLGGGEASVEVAGADRAEVLVVRDGRWPAHVPLRLDLMQVRDSRVILGRRPTLRVVEHLFSALAGLELYAIRIQVSGPEVPFFDGSSRDFARGLASMRNGVSAPTLKCDREILVRRQDSFLRYTPEGDRLKLDLVLEHPCIGRQHLEAEIDPEYYLAEIAPARTYAFTTDDDPRFANLPPYGFGITPGRVYSREPLRYPDECVRHKALDLIGDLYALQARIVGSIQGRNPNHALNLALARRLAACGAISGRAPAPVAPG